MKDEKSRQDDEYRKRQLETYYYLAALYNQLAESVAGQFSKLNIDDLDRPFSFTDHKRFGNSVDRQINALSSTVEGHIDKNVEHAFALADKKAAAIVSSIEKKFDGKLPVQPKPDVQKQLFQFKKRKIGGLTYSQRVWQYNSILKGDLQRAIDAAMREGISAQDMARDIKKYLNSPDALFRRVRDRDGNLRLSKAAANYHPGQGVYRSAHKNALRLARETYSTAFREREHEQMQGTNFIVGFKIKNSNRTESVCDLCRRFDGAVFPKSFEWTGFHVQCMCQRIFVRCPDDGIRRIMFDDPDYVPEQPPLPEELKKYQRELKAKQAKNATFAGETVKVVNLEIKKALEKYNSYDTKIWEKVFFDENSGGFNVYHKKHNFTKEGRGGEVEKIAGKMLANEGKQVEFLPEGGKKMPDIRFDNKTWDVKYIDYANEATIRKAIRDSVKADNAIFYFTHENKYLILKSATEREVGRFSKGQTKVMSDIYYITKEIKLNYYGLEIHRLDCEYNSPDCRLKPIEKNKLKFIEITQE